MSTTPISHLRFTHSSTSFCRTFPPWILSRVSMGPSCPRKWTFSSHGTRFVTRHLRSTASDGEQMESVETPKSSTENQGLKESDSNEPATKKFSSNDLMQKLKRYGLSGVLSYGLLNTVYYLTTFLLVWFYFAPAPGRMGYAASVERFLKIMAMVWAGSQVTKLVRAAGALALAPIVDRGLSWFTAKFKFESQGKAFAAIAGLCFGMAIVLFLVLTLLWA
ncbi:hypothetical protein QJS10_CPB19g01888 [Acorus calamus]|uniref:Gag-Pol polyprotein/retrotransposon n=1 Tax=Acorus calamus TaxID=4465 RepID=A0AAV9CFQ9_ACOCL|nr:hypothetical protein QJS10_CPB19g01888 [Acorus calamus]